MTAPPRPTPAQLAAEHCRIGHRLGPEENLLGDRYCVDCGALARPYQGRTLWWPPDAPGRSFGSAQRPPCPASEVAE